MGRHHGPGTATRAPRAASAVVVLAAGCGAPAAAGPAGTDAWAPGETLFLHQFEGSRLDTDVWTHRDGRARAEPGASITVDGRLWVTRGPQARHDGGYGVASLTDFHRCVDDVAYEVTFSFEATPSGRARPLDVRTPIGTLTADGLVLPSDPSSALVPWREATPFVAGRAHRVRLEARGDHLRVLLDAGNGPRVLADAVDLAERRTDPREPLAGRILLGNDEWGVTTYDDVRVASLTEWNCLARRAGAPEPPAPVLRFAGREWTVKSGIHAPGPTFPNVWDPDNVFVDAAGALHLRIVQSGGAWTSAEVISTERLGFGHYEFLVVGRPDRFDPNVVLGLFNYPTPDVGGDHTHEVDVELSRWGLPDRTHVLGYTVWFPATPLFGLPRRTVTYPLELQGTHSAHRFEWRRDRVHFSSHHGHRADEESLIVRWDYLPREDSPLVPVSRRVAQKPMPVHINLWLMDAVAPTDRRPVEIVITGFRYTP